MSAAINRRQQARNERALQDLIKSIPGNNSCADCAARNPGWASWNLGIFLCMRCAALHRKLGTHISKVKSLSMDTWSVDQVENMKRIGNVTSNKLYNPSNKRAAIPVDIDEVDSAMERFIRDKYQRKSLSGQHRPVETHQTGSTSSEELRTLPPKPNKRFTLFRTSTRKTAPQSISPPLSPESDGFGGSREMSSPPRKNKPSQIFGADIGGSRRDNYELKLITLREMGFSDDRRNLTILKGEGGNVNRTVATLIRIGEGKISSAAPEHVDADRSRPGFDRVDTDKDLPPPPMFEEPTPKKAEFDSSNPFVQMHQQFQGLQVQQHLFPNTTGGYNNVNQTQQSNPFLQTYTPPPSSHVPSQFTAPVPFAPTVAAQTPQATAGNPFLRTSRSQVFESSNSFNPSLATAVTFDYPHSQQDNPFGVQISPQQASPAFPSPFDLQHQAPQQSALTYPLPIQLPSPTNPFPSSSHSSQVSSQQAHNPFASQHQTASPQLTYYTQSPVSQSPTTAGKLFFQQAPQDPFAQQSQTPQPAQQALRMDKASILSLYAAPHLAPPRTDTMPLLSQHSDQPAMPGAQRSVTMPLPSQSTNPFGMPAANGTTYVQPISAVPQGIRHVSHESVDFLGSGMFDSASGRHSPDAFASLAGRRR